MKYEITASVILYHTPQSQIESLMKSIVDSRCIDRLYVIDNASSKDNDVFFSTYKQSQNLEYIPHENTGYGASHNITIKKAIEEGSIYHIILNPDIYFESNVLKEIKSFMDTNSDVGYLLPKVVYPDGSIQYLCKLLPRPTDSFCRRFASSSSFFQNRNTKYELRHSGYDKIINPPCLSGCFMFLRLDILKKNNLFFDESFFMYFEDFDLIRRIHRVSKTIFYPKVTIVHNHTQASYKRKKMLFIHIISAIRYFNKWGWFFDKERHVMNKKILKEIDELNNQGS